VKAPPITTDYDEMMRTHLAKLRNISWFEGEEDYVWLLERSTPDDWHRIAMNASWDCVDPEVFEWIASRPNCEAATALVLFWMVRPDYYFEAGRDRDVLNDTENPDVVTDRLRHFDMIEYIRSRWFSDGYPNRTISFEYDRDLWTNEFESMDRQYGPLAAEYAPTDMRQPISGRSHDELLFSVDFPEEFKG
jgi:Domain of unknown function (DUF4274)